MQTRRLTPTIGVEITGVDLSAPLDDATFAAIRESWLHAKSLPLRRRGSRSFPTSTSLNRI